MFVVFSFLFFYSLFFAAHNFIFFQYFISNADQYVDRVHQFQEEEEVQEQCVLQLAIRHGQHKALIVKTTIVYTLPKPKHVRNGFGLLNTMLFRNRRTKLILILLHLGQKRHNQIIRVAPKERGDVFKLQDDFESE